MTPFAYVLVGGALSNAIMAAIVACVALLVTRMVRRPALAHALWALVLLKLVSPPLIALPLPGLFATRTSVAVHEIQASAAPIDLQADHFAALASAPPIAAIPRADEPVSSAGAIRALGSIEPGLDPVDPHRFGLAPWHDLASSLLEHSGPLILAVWLCGTTISFLVVGHRLRLFARILRKTDSASDELRIEVRELSTLVGLRRPPDVRTCDATVPPFAWAMTGRPQLILPRGLLETLAPRERSTLLAHELAHIARRDHLVRWLEVVVVGLYWWFPIAWLARRQVHAAAEQCCDAMVLRRFPQLATTYARALLKTLDFVGTSSPALPAGAMGFAQIHQLKRRFAMILRGDTYDRLPRAVAVAVAVVAALILPMSLRSSRAFEAQTEGSPKATAAGGTEDEQKDAGAAEDGTPDMAQRLERLEGLVESLSRELRSTHRDSSRAPPLRPAPTTDANARPTAPASPPGEPADATSVPVFSADVRYRELLENDEQRFAEVLKAVDRQIQLMNTNMKRREAALINAKAVEAAYAAGTVTLDLLLDAQRRVAVTESDYADATLRLAGFVPEKERERLLATVTLDSLLVARDKSLGIWREVKARYDAGARGGSAEQEAQAREQYFRFRGQVELATKAIQDARDRNSRIDGAESQK